MLIPFERLQPDTLRRLIEEFVTRDGTDYGERDVSLDAKVAEIMRQLRAGIVVIAFDPEAESANVVDKREYLERSSAGR